MLIITFSGDNNPMGSCRGAGELLNAVHTCPALVMSCGSHLLCGMNLLLLLHQGLNLNPFATAASASTGIMDCFQAGKWDSKF